MKTKTFNMRDLGKILSVAAIGFIPLISSGQTIMFDDFNYAGPSDAQLSFNKWTVVDGLNGPPSNAQYSKNNVTFISDPSNANNKLMTLSTTVNGTSRATTHSRIETVGYEYFEGTYAARVNFSDVPFQYKDANIQTFYTIVSYLLGGDGSKYSEIDFEYMAADKWGTSTDKQVMYMTSWNRYIAEPWQAWKNHFTQQKSFAGWHTCVVSCTNGVDVKFWLDGIYLGSMAKTDNDGSSVYPRNPMQVAFANWIWNNVIGPSTANRTTTMQVDWTLFAKNSELNPTQVDAQVAAFRSQGVLRRNLLGQEFKTTPANQNPIVSLTSPSNGASYVTPASITISANATDADGSIVRVEFYQGNTLLASDNTSPYSFVWSGVGAGSYSITAKAIDNFGASSTSAASSVIVTSPAVQAPYTGVPISLPGIIEAENFDIGGQGVAFNELTAANQGGKYRTEAVDIESAVSGGYNVGWIQAGEWLEYSVNVSAAGQYSFQATVAAISAGNSFQVELDGVRLGTFAVPNTGGWQTWQTISLNNISLTPGNKILRLNFVTGNHNLDKVVVASGETSFSKFIEAESYSSMSGVQKEPTTDVGGGQNVGYVDVGDWMSYYAINFPSTGQYKVEYRVASVAGSTLDLDLNGGAIYLGSITIPATGGWQNWTTVSHVVNVTAGTYDLGTYASGSGWNLNWIRITKVSSSRDVEITTTISETSSFENQLVISPNPVQQELVIETYNLSNGGTVRLLRMDGNEVLSTEFVARIDVSALSQGCYLLEYTTLDQQKIIKKFIKQ